MFSRWLVQSEPAHRLHNRRSVRVTATALGGAGEVTAGGLDMRKVVQRCAVLGVLALAPYHAAANSGQEWSAITGKTLGEGATAVHLQAAWPGVSLTLAHGYSPSFDYGGTFTFNYSYEGDVRVAYPGVKLQGYLK